MPAGDGTPTHRELNIGTDFFVVKAVERTNKYGQHDGYIVTFFCPVANAVVVKHSYAFSWVTFDKTPNSILQDYAGYL